MSTIATLIQGSTVPNLPPPVGERRQAERIAAPPLNVSGVWATVRDVSASGICLELSGGSMRKGEVHNLILTDGDSFCTEALDAEVIWYSDGCAGLTWKDLSDRQKAWLHDRFDDWRGVGRRSVAPKDVEVDWDEVVSRLGRGVDWNEALSRVPDPKGTNPQISQI